MNGKSSDSQLPRFTKLPAFDPHRADFNCKREADVNPPISEEAEAIFQRALSLDSYEIWPSKRDYRQIVVLYEQATKLGHWKAQFNLAGAYLQGVGVTQDIEKAMALNEDLMTRGVPAAWDNMGTYYMGGVGPLKQDASVAYAFWQRAADLGSMASQTYIGAKLMGVEDSPPEWWANQTIGLKMLECAYSQGYAKAAYELGLEYRLRGEDDSPQKQVALQYFHEAVKLGSEEAAGALFASFHSGPFVKSSVAATIDTARAERYLALNDAISRNRDLRFPNLDKVLPLPPASLPQWDGNKQTLIDAAKAVVPAPPPPPEPIASAASQRTGRAHIPDGWVLPEVPQVAVHAQWETVSAPESGYWIARLLHPRTERHRAWDAAQLPLRYNRGELFDRTRPGLQDEDGRIKFHYLGQPIARPSAPPSVEDPLVARGVARYGDLPEPSQRCRGHLTCPKTGVWAASVATDHARSRVFNRWDRQSYLMQGQRFPDPKTLHLDIDHHDLSWQWLGNANESRARDLVCIVVSSHSSIPRQL